MCTDVQFCWWTDAIDRLIEALKCFEKFYKGACILHFWQRCKSARGHFNLDFGSRRYICPAFEFYDPWPIFDDLRPTLKQ